MRPLWIFLGILVQCIQTQEDNNWIHDTPPDTTIPDHLYTGPRLEVGVTMESVHHMISWFISPAKSHKGILENIQRNHLPYRYIDSLLRMVKPILAAEPYLVHINDVSKTTIVGDIHGQFLDLLHIFAINGYPSEGNRYIFNGDFVDRGEASLKVVLTLFALKAALPHSIHLNRGNHEVADINGLYGFKDELYRTYPRQAAAIYAAINEAFQLMPIAHIVSKAYFVVHGGLPPMPIILESTNLWQHQRKSADPTLTDPLVMHFLWSDPRPEPGIGGSERGLGLIKFGPDVTDAFLRVNNLAYLVRSHEVKDAGYEIAHNGKCITVFSAPHYAGSMLNLAAIMIIEADGKSHRFVQFRPAFWT